MKTYEEMAKSALDRIKEHNDKQKKRRKTAIKIATPTVCFCLIAALCIGVLKFGLLKPNSPLISTDTYEKNSQTQSTNNAEDNDIIKDKEDNDVTKDKSVPNTVKGEAELKISDESGFCGFWWKNKIVVSGMLRNEMMANPTGKIKVRATYRPTTANITSFTYKGKTLAELAIDADNERLMPDKMAELLKLGDELKYGTALYETGTPTGEKWIKELYEEKVAYFGEELLNKYIVNGEFLKEALTKDIAEYNKTSAMEKYKLAYNAYLDTVMTSAVKKLTDNNIKCERCKYDNNSIALVVTASELENLPLNDLNYWYFDLETNNTKGFSDEEAKPSGNPAITN